MIVLFYRNYSEQLVAYESLRSGAEDLRIIVSTERVRVVAGTNGHSLAIVIETHLRYLLFRDRNLFFLFVCCILVIYCNANLLP